MIAPSKICNSIKLSNTHLHTPVVDLDWCRSSYGYPRESLLVTEAVLDGLNAPTEKVPLLNLSSLVVISSCFSLTRWLCLLRCSRSILAWRDSVASCNNRSGLVVDTIRMGCLRRIINQYPQMICEDRRARTSTWSPPAASLTR